MEVVLLKESMSHVQQNPSNMDTLGTEEVSSDLISALNRGAVIRGSN